MLDGACEQLLVKRSGYVGKRNAWRLTARGEEISHVLRAVEDATLSAGTAGS